MFSLHFLPSSQSQSCFLFFAIPHIRHTIIIIARSLTRKAAELCHCVSYTLTQLLTCAHSNCISQRENERGEMNLEKVKFTHQPRLITDHWSALDIKPDNEGPWWITIGDLDPGGNYHRWNVQLHNTDDNAEKIFNAVHKLEDEVDKLDKNWQKWSLVKKSENEKEKFRPWIRKFRPWQEFWA